MRPMSARTSRAARVAAMPLVAAVLVSSACSDQPAATAPIGVRPEVSAEPVSTSISTDPITDIVTAVTAAWTAKDASTYESTLVRIVVSHCQTTATWMFCSVTSVASNIPSLRRGSRADLRMQRYLMVIGAAWGGQTTSHRVMSSPASPWLR